MRFPTRSGRRRWRSPRALTIGVAATVTVLTGPTSAASAPPDYPDRRKPVAVRGDDLVRRMTTEETAGQLQQIAVARLQGDCQWSGGELNQQCMKEVLADQHVGSILSGGGMTPAENTPEEWAKMVKDRKSTRLNSSHVKISY